MAFPNPQFGQQGFPGVISLQNAGTPSAPRSLSWQDIQKYAQNALSKTPANQYWQVEKPTRGLSLGGANTYVANNYARQPLNNPFIYYPDLAMAGTAENIYNTLARAGVTNIEVGKLNQMTNGRLGAPRSLIPLSPENLINNSFNPSNPASHEEISQLTSESRKRNQVAKTRFTLEQHIQIGTAIRNSKKVSGNTIPAVTQVIPGQPAQKVKGGNNKLFELIATFENAMENALAGRPNEHVVNVNNYEPVRFTGARKAVPTTTSRATAITPYINIQGRQVPVPVVAQPSSAQNFGNYLNTVVANSRYGQYAPAIQEAFGRAMPQGTLNLGYQPAPVLGNMTQPIPGYAGSPAGVQPFAANLPGVSTQAFGAASPGYLPHV